MVAGRVRKYAHRAVDPTPGVVSRAAEMGRRIMAASGFTPDDQLAA